MRGKKWLMVLLVLAVVATGLWMWWRSPKSSLKQGVTQKVEKLVPELKIASMNITDIDADKISATSKVTLKNNLPVEIKTKQLDYVIYIDSTKIIEDSYKKPIVFKPSGTSEISLPMEILFKNAAAVMKRFDKQKTDSANYTMKASFEVDVPIAGERKFTVNFSKRLPALRPLKFRMKDVDLGKLGLKETGLNATVSVENPNAFSVKMMNGKYKLSIDDDKNMMEGSMEPVVNIPAHGTEDITMHVDMKTGKVPKLGWKMLFDQKDTHFKMNFSCKLASDNGMLNNSQMAMNMQGTLDELSSAVQK